MRDERITSHKLERKKLFTLLGIALLASLPVLALGTPVLSALGPADNGNNSIPPFTHVFYIMMENNGVGQIVGNSYAPYVNQLINTYGYDNNYFGVTHDSLANYIAAISGNNWYTYSDDPTQTFNHSNLVDQLVAHNISWKAYMESMPYPGFTGYWYPDNEPSGTSPSTTPPNALYALKHNPFLLFDDVVGNPQLANQVVPLTQLTADLNGKNVPQFVWISPNVCNDMHGQPTGSGNTCPYTDPNGLIQDGDNFLKQWVSAIMDSNAWSGNSVIFITWDETAYPPTTSGSTFIAPGPDAPIAPSSVFVANGVTPPSGTYGGYSGGVFGGGNVPLIVITTHMDGPITINTWADHYSILRTIEQSWNLGYLGMASDGAQVQSLTGFFQQGNPHDGGIFSDLQTVESEFARPRAQSS